MDPAEIRLTTPKDWSRRGSRIERHPNLARAPWFRQQARVLGELLEPRAYGSAIEVGVYPGNILAWMANRLGIKATGLEYVPEQAAAVRSTFPELQIIEGDFLADSWCERGRTWDIVASFGLVEHWADPTAILTAHQDRVSPAGCCVIGVPNHAGVYGSLMRRMDAAMWNRHSRISARELRAAFLAAATGPWRIDYCEEIEGAGLWNCGVYEWIQRQAGMSRTWLDAGYGTFHRLMPRCPIPPGLRANILLVATRIASTDG